MSQTVLEETKAFYQEQLLRKAAQAEAITAMDEEKKRSVSNEFHQGYPATWEGTEMESKYLLV